jgi:hypothetical protein
MIKDINISGKHNLDRINGTYELDRPNMPYQEQIALLNKVYLEEEKDKTKIITREIIKKINGYKNQDVKKHIFNKNKLISFNETIEKLVISKLKCHYCFQKMNIIFTKPRDETQWTLDRINNDLCHSNDNTVVSCLKCNLQRRCQDAKKFTFTKQLRIRKIDN